MLSLHFLALSDGKVLRAKCFLFCRGSPCLITSKSFLEWYLSNAMSAVVCTAANDKPLDPLLPIEQEIAQNDMAQDHCASKNLVCRTSCTYGMNLTKPYTTDLTW
mmetsp:Transcript_11164/g.37931  ORF Transcript_11164/g.37931 Transcript_11164/m.37931 type:complete len:105 (-) Transcript_11164:1201-1515(-)